MNLRKRLIISFFIIVFVPICLISVSLWGFLKYYNSSIERMYDIDSSSYDYLGTPINLLNQYTKDTYKQLYDKIENSPEDLMDTKYLDGINKKLLERDSYIIVRVDNNIIYSGSKKDISELTDSLPKYGTSSSNIDVGIYIGGKLDTLAKQLDFTYNSSKCSIFIITPIQTFTPGVKLLLTEVIISIFLILVFTSLILTMWIYKGIINPLQNLKAATKNIKDGNLDFTIETDIDDEIGELCNDFEEMRQRLKISAEEKVEYDRENRELISNISHDLKTPITAVKGYVEGIMDGVADTPEKMDKYIRTIYNKANEMDSLINELTFYSKIDTNRIPYTFKRINVARYFEDCVDELSLNLESKNIELRYFNNASEDIEIIADSEQLSRVINNIVGNSVKYIDKPKGFINIRIKDVGDFIQIEIEDNGKGIAAKDLQYIFDRFYRTDASRNSSQGGSGIGLSIVKKIIEDHGGKIWVSSKEGTGTVMYFVLRKYQEVPINE